MTQNYCWQDKNGAWQIGRKVLVDQPWLRDGEANHLTIVGVIDTHCLVRHLYTGTLEFVYESKLKPYPESPIPEPTK